MYTILSLWYVNRSFQVTHFARSVIFCHDTLSRLWQFDISSSYFRIASQFAWMSVGVRSFRGAVFKCLLQLRFDFDSTIRLRNNQRHQAGVYAQLRVLRGPKHVAGFTSRFTTHNGSFPATSLSRLLLYIILLSLHHCISSWIFNVA